MEPRGCMLSGDGRGVAPGGYARGRTGWVHGFRGGEGAHSPLKRA